MKLDGCEELFYVDYHDVLQLGCGHSVNEARAAAHRGRLSGCTGWWKGRATGDVEEWVSLGFLALRREQAACRAPLIVLAGLR